MDSIRIKAGVTRLLINDGPDVLEFNPSDVLFAEKFYHLVKNFEAKQAEYGARAEEIDQVTDLDDYGLPVNLNERVQFLRDVYEFLHAGIDSLFGNGTSHKLFGDALSLEMIGEFFDGITPFFEKARSAKLARYRAK